jgi:hypothetical protein
MSEKNSLIYSLKIQLGPLQPPSLLGTSIPLVSTKRFLPSNERGEISYSITGFRAAIKPQNLSNGFGDDDENPKVLAIGGP